MVIIEFNHYSLHQAWRPELWIVKQNKFTVPSACLPILLPSIQTLICNITLRPIAKKSLAWSPDVWFYSRHLAIWLLWSVNISAIGYLDLRSIYWMRSSARLFVGKVHAILKYSNFRRNQYSFGTGPVSIELAEENFETPFLDLHVGRAQVLSNAISGKALRHVLQHHIGNLRCCSIELIAE